MIQRFAIHTATAVILLLALTLLLGCATIKGLFAKSPVGQAIQAADFEQKLIVAAARQVKAMCTSTPPKLTAASCASSQAAYGKWRAAQITAGNAIATWKAVSTAGAESPELATADAKVRAALDELAPLAAAALDLYKQFVDVKKLEQQITPAPQPAPTTWIPVSPWLALEVAR